MSDKEYVGETAIFIRQLEKVLQALRANIDDIETDDFALYDLGFLAIEANKGTIETGTAGELFDIADAYDYTPRQESLDKLTKIGKEYDV